MAVAIELMVPPTQPPSSASSLPRLPTHSHGCCLPPPACSRHSYPEVDTARILRKLERQGVEATLKALHHARKKEIQKVRRRLRREAERAARAAKQYAWPELCGAGEACLRQRRREEAQEMRAAALLCLARDALLACPTSGIQHPAHTARLRCVPPSSDHVQAARDGLASAQARESGKASWKNSGPKECRGQGERAGDSGVSQGGISHSPGSDAAGAGMDGLSMVVEDKKIQLLADRLNKADHRISKWAFSKLIRSCRLRMSDDRVLRIVKLLGEKGNWKHAMRVVSWLHSRQRHWKYQSRYVYTTLLSVLGSAHKPVEALEIFNKMQESVSSYPDMAAYHCIAVILGQAGHLHRLLEIIAILKNGSSVSRNKNLAASLFPDIIVYNAVLNACVPLKEWRHALCVWTELYENGIPPNSATYGLMMEVMVKSGIYVQVFLYYVWMQRAGFVPNASTYKSLVEAFGRSGLADEAVSLVDEMEHYGIAGSSGVYYSLACALCMAGKWQEALRQVNRIRKFHFRKSDVITYTGLIQACHRGGHLHDAISLFNYAQIVSSPNTFMCNVMINIYGKNHMFHAAMALYEAMKTGSLGAHSAYKSKGRIRPDFFSFQAMVEACILAKAWSYLQTVYTDMTMKGYPLFRTETCE